jgi:hypothetical protein
MTAASDDSLGRYYGEHYSAVVHWESRPRRGAIWRDRRVDIAIATGPGRLNQIVYVATVAVVVSANFLVLGHAIVHKRGSP